jgi:hypothetical protein
LSSCVVSFYNPSLKKTAQFYGTSACFIPPSKSNRNWGAAVYVTTVTGSLESVYIIDLQSIAASEGSAPSSVPIQLLNELRDSETPVVSMSVVLPVTQRYLGVLPPSALCGTLVSAYDSNNGMRLCVLTCTGQMHVVDANSASILSSVGVSDELIVSSYLDVSNLSKPALVFLSGNKGKLVKILPSAFLS